MYEVGRLCVKLAGRDARKKGIIVEVLDDHYVILDGQTRRRKVNINHIEPLDKVVKVKEGASHADVVKALEKEGIKVEEKKSKPKKTRTKKKKKVKSPDKPKKKKAPKKKSGKKAKKTAKSK